MHPGRGGRGEDFAVRALRPVAGVLSVPPGRLPRRSSRTGWRTSASIAAAIAAARTRGAAVGAAARLALAAAWPAVRPRLRGLDDAAARMSRPAAPKRHSTRAARGWSDERGRIVDVAVGVLIRADGGFLLAQRPAGKPYAGYWEFPGGKLEPGETVARRCGANCTRNSASTSRAVRPWVVREHDYPHAHVRLHFCRVVDWHGEPHGAKARRSRSSLGDRARRCCRRPCPCCAGSICADYASPDATAMGSPFLPTRAPTRAGLLPRALRSNDLDRPSARHPADARRAYDACGGRRSAGLRGNRGCRGRWHSPDHAISPACSRAARCARVCASTHDAAQLERPPRWARTSRCSVRC